MFEVTGRDGSIWVQRVGLLLTRTANILRFTDAQALADRLNAAEAAHATLTERGGVMAAVNFADILAKINTAAQIAAAAQPDIVQFSTDHAAGTQQLLQLAGAAVASETTDSTVQSEAVESAQLASSLVPDNFALFSLFHKKKTAA